MSFIIDYLPRIPQIKGLNTDFLIKGIPLTRSARTDFTKPSGRIRTVGSNLWNPSAQSAFVESDFFLNLRFCER